MAATPTATEVHAESDVGTGPSGTVAAPATVAVPGVVDDVDEPVGLHPLERRGRWWVFGSFVFCPCHLPLSLGLLVTVFGGTALGVVVREHAWVAGTVITLAWVVGTWYGFRLLRRAQAGGACPLPRERAWRRWLGRTSPEVAPPTDPSGRPRRSDPSVQR